MLVEEQLNRDEKREMKKSKKEKDTFIDARTNKPMFITTSLAFGLLGIRQIKTRTLDYGKERPIEVARIHGITTAKNIINKLNALLPIAKEIDHPIAETLNDMMKDINKQIRVKEDNEQKLSRSKKGETELGFKLTLCRNDKTGLKDILDSTLKAEKGLLNRLASLTDKEFDIYYYK